jgi:L-threonylcarbamoyladenylate synthase
VTAPADSPDVGRAVAVLRRGGLVAFPTETVYGLGADATSDAALGRLYAVKGRPADHPVILHLGHDADLDEWAADVPAVARALVARCWPGPLTIVVPASDRVSRVATGGLETVGLRVPDHPLALALLDAFGGAVAAPSANRFGRVSPTTAGAVTHDLGGDVDIVLDGGPCSVGVESTIVDCTGAEPRVLRVGGVTLEALAEVLHGMPAVGGATRAPGTLASHYAPNARVEVVTPDTLAARTDELDDGRRRIGVMGLASDLSAVGMHDALVPLARPVDAIAYARELYGALRQADDLGLDVVLAIAPPSSGLGLAVADRLSRAAHGH